MTDQLLIAILAVTGLNTLIHGVNAWLRWILVKGAREAAIQNLKYAIKVHETGRAERDRGEQ